VRLRTGGLERYTADERRLVEWLSGVVRGEERPLEPLSDELVVLVRRSRLEPLVALSGSDDPRLARSVARFFARTVAVEAASQTVVDLLRDAGVACVTLKGPALAARYWGDVARRASSDVDILVAPSDLARAETALADAGLVKRSDYPDWFQRHWHFHVTLSLPRTRMSVELHWSLVSHELGRLPVERMVASAEWVTCGRFELPSLEASWQLVATSIHCFQHLFSLRELIDVALVARRLGAGDWERAVDEARAAGLGGALYYAVTVSAERLGWCPPPVVLGLRPGVVRDALVRSYVRRLPATSVAPPPLRRLGRFVTPLAAGSAGRGLAALPRSLTRGLLLMRVVERLRFAGRLLRRGGR